MDLKLVAFGITKDIMGARNIDFRLSEGQTVGDLKQSIRNSYPALQDLAHLNVAVNAEYVDDTYQLNPHDEVVLIPPVSGG